MTTPTTRRRGRRPKTYAAVLEAMTELLRTRSLAGITVAQILAAAEVGRTSFYEHFASKEDVVVKLMRSISDEATEGMAPMFERGRREPEAAFRAGLTGVIETSARYGPLLAAVAEEWPAVPELRAIWLATLGGLSERLARLIDEDRAAGIAPPGTPSLPLAASLVWTAERAFHVSAAGVDATLGEPEALIEPLVALFVGSIYGSLPAGPAGPAG